MGFTQAIATCMGKYFTFSGRASRSEFWWFYLFTILFTWAASIVFFITFPDPVIADAMVNIVSLVFLFPTLAVGSRRLHDIGKSGWWQLLILTIIGIILLIVWYATDSQKEDNKYGNYLQE